VCRLKSGPPSSSTPQPAPFTKLHCALADHVCCSLQRREFIRVVAFLHSVDYKKVGLGAYGKEGSYYARQVRPATLVGVDLNT
jgi:hypothetical protein